MKYLLNYMVDSGDPSPVVEYPQRSRLFMTSLNIRMEILPDVQICCRVGMGTNKNSRSGLFEHFLDPLSQRVGFTSSEWP